MDAEKVLDTINNQQWLEEPAATVQKAVLAPFEAGGEAGTKAKDFLHGRWLGHSLHPAITDVPLGAWTTAAIFDALSACFDKKELDNASDTTIAIGLVGAIGAATTGLVDWAPVEERPRKVGLVHAVLNVAATGFYLVSWLMRRSGDENKRGTARSLAWTGYALASCGAWLGGALVATEKMGVDNAPRENWPQEWQAAIEARKVGEGQLVKAIVNDQAIVLTQRNGEFYALAELCSHLAGPLSEGEFCDKDGELALKCPWHASCFALRDGKVLEGPATHPQPSFKTRLRDGKIEVKQKVF